MHSRFETEYFLDQVLSFNTTCQVQKFAARERCKVVCLHGLYVDPTSLLLVFYCVIARYV